MRKLILALIAVAVFAAAVPLSSRGAGDNPFGDADADPAPFNPQMGALMGMLILPRHAKVGLAGQQENWPLAAYAFKELRQGLFIVAKAVPRWKGLPVPDLLDAAMTQPLTVLDFAIKAGEPRHFADAYAKLTAGCNACHATTDHPFIVIKTPDASMFPNQEFSIKK